jgi:hypothetical protein
MLAGLTGAMIATALAEVVIGPALNAQGSSLEMGGIPLLLSAIVFAPLIAAMVAGLAASSRPYVAGAVGAVALDFMATAFTNGSPTIISPPLLPLYVAIGLWGSLIVDSRLAGRAARFRDFRDGSFTFSVIVAFLALLGAAIYWVPWKIGVALEVLFLVAFFGWIALRNRRARPGLPDRTESFGR